MFNLRFIFRRNRHVRMFGAVLATALITGAVACGDDSVAAPPVTTSLQLASPKLTIEVGEALTITALAFDARDSLVNNPDVTWSANPSAVVTVADGVVTGVAPGTAVVQATVQSAMATLAVDVVPAAASGVSLSAPNVTLAPGASVTIAAVVRDARNAPLLGRVVTWTSSDTRRVQVNTDGIATAVSAGTAYIVARSESARDSLLLTIAGTSETSLELTPNDVELSVGRTRTLAPRLRDASGELSIPDAVTWQSDNASIAAVANGVVTGVASGTTVIRATKGNMTATASVKVSLGGTVFSTGTATLNVATIRADSINISGTLTVLGPLTLVSSGDIVITGAIVTPCSPLTLIAAGRIIVTAGPPIRRVQIDNICETGIVPNPAPDIRIDAAGGYAFTWSVVRSTGAIAITNDGGLVAADFVGIPTARESENCFMAYSTIEQRAGSSAITTIGANGRDNKEIDVSCRGSYRTRITDLNAGGGGNGVASTNAVSATAGNGGRSGRVRFRVTGDVIIDERRLYLRIYPSGNGGDATATPSGTDGANATAVGGRGGDIGGPGQPPIEFRVAGDVIVNYPGTGNAIELGVFFAGSGGNAVASGAAGRDATALLPAGAGGTANAIGGRGGNVYPSVIAVGGTLPYNMLWLLGQGGGAAGSATATGGTGGRGSDAFPNGGPGGAVLAEGGNGGVAAVESNPPTLSASPGGSGGAAKFLGGIGGNGFDRCSPVGIGGRGGAGGMVSGFDGLGGIGRTNGAAGGISIETAANGGAGGRGTTPGVGGRAGNDATQTRGVRNVVPVSFADGATGGGC